MDTRARLRAILKDILEEEEKFQRRSERMLPTEDQIYEEHLKYAPYITESHSHNRIRVVHEAIFKVHRKIAREHKQIIDKCRMLLTRLNRDELTDQELAYAFEMFEDKLTKLRGEHQLIDLERQKILHEHNMFIKSLKSDSDNNQSTTQ